MTKPTSPDWPRALALFDAASALEPPARELWRATLGEADRAALPLLDQLLGAHRRVETADILNTLPPQFAAGTAAQAPDAFSPGQCIGDFELIERIGTGGMGSVWRARYRDGRLQREVAIKLPRRAELGGSSQVAERLARERDVLTPLAHPHIARLLDAGVAADGQPYLALELVQGEAIDRWADARRMNLNDRVRLMCAVLDAVDYAHRNLVLHRDIKPANILVDATGAPKLLDFGVAKLMPSVSSSASTTAMLSGDDATPPEAASADDLTRIEAPAMTLAFAAPEQIRRGALTTATDVYACGVLLYRLLTGSLPHQPPRETRAALEETILTREPDAASRRVVSAEVATARSSTPTDLRRALQGDLDTVLQKALKIDPAARYPTAAAMADDLRRHLTQQPILARADSRWYVASRFVARHRVAVAASALGVLALTGATSAALWQASVAKAHAARAEKASARAAAAQQFFAGLFASADPEQNKNITELDRKMIDRAFATAEAQFGGEPETLAMVLKQIADIYYRLGVSTSFLKVYQRRAELVDANPDLPVDQRAGAYSDLTRAQLEAASREDRERALGSARRATDIALGRASPAVEVDALALRSTAERVSNQTDAALATAQQAVAIAEKKLQEPNESLALAFAVRGLAQRSLGQFDQAVLDFRRAAEINRTGKGQSVSSQVTNLIALAGAEYQAARFDLAVAAAREAIALAEQKLGASGDLLMPAKSLGISALERMGDLVGAQLAVNEWLRDDLVSVDAFVSARAHFAQAVLAVAQSRGTLARQSLGVALSKFGDRPLWVARVRSAQGAQLLREGGVNAASEALAILTPSLVELSAKSGTASPEYVLLAQRRAVAFARSGELAQAREDIHNACRTVAATRGLPHPDRVRCEAYRLLLDDRSSVTERQQQLAALQRDFRASRNDQMQLQGDLIAALSWLQQDQSPAANTSFPLLN